MVSIWRRITLIFINPKKMNYIEYRFHLVYLFIFIFIVGLTSHYAAGQSRPNILFAIADDASYPHMGAYGTDWIETPAFDRIAEEGILFNRAYVPNPKCGPSRSIILTGRNSWQLEEAANHWAEFPQKFKVYTEVLAEHGFHVGSTGKGWAPGVATNKQGEKRYLAGQPYNEITQKSPTSGISNNNYAANFEAFLKKRDQKGENTPFAFWYGGYEPHRRYEYESGKRKGDKMLSDIDEVPAFWPNTDSVRTDMLDYAYEIEHFDDHLAEMLRILEEQGELDNTLVVVTADNGMPFPRVKGQTYEMSAHLPLAIMWPEGIENPGRVVDDVISFADFAPTFIELAGLHWQQTGLHPTVGKSLTDIFYTTKDGQVNPDRNSILLGKERHDIGRPYDHGYPIRGILKKGMLYVKNFKSERWPVGNPETGYLNTDGSPTKSYILNNRPDPRSYHYWKWNFGKRPQEELYDVNKDPYCLNNLVDDPVFNQQKEELKKELYRELKKQDDPRVFGKGYIFETYTYMDKNNTHFYRRYMAGEEMNTGWVNESDFEDAWLPGQRN